jgi:hypothetical protein
MPIVVMNEGVKESSLNRKRQHDFPTPESPISNSLICGFWSACEDGTAAEGHMYQEVIIARPSHLGFGRVEIGKQGSLLTAVDSAVRWRGEGCGAECGSGSLTA